MQSQNTLKYSLKVNCQISHQIFWNLQYLLSKLLQYSSRQGFDVKSFYVIKSGPLNHCCMPILCSESLFLKIIFSGIWYHIINEITVSWEHKVRFQTKQKNAPKLSWHNSHSGNIKKSTFELLNQLVHFNMLSHKIVSRCIKNKIMKYT